MAASLRFRVYDPGLGEALGEVFDSLDNLSPFFRRWFVPQYLKDVQENFASEGGLVGGWAPLSPEYNAWKEKNYPGRGLNILKDRLRKSMSLKGRSKYLILDIQRRQAVIGSNHPHAFWVQQVRPFMIPQSMLDSGTYHALLVDFLEGVLKKSGLRGRRTRTAATPPVAGPVSAFGPSFFDPAARWTPAHWARWPEGPGGGARRQSAPEPEEDDEDF